ncbi:hypothetical protein BGZ63DRAFT_406386 [Mariannaea sp. PMI_226]|nr:hypothetical protein BGZ63DRAFT_406386 [Mariannaea sp. PMI_226]
MAQGRISDDWSEIDEVASVVSISSDADEYSDHEGNEKNDDSISNYQSQPALLRSESSDASAACPSPYPPIAQQHFENDSPGPDSPPCFTEAPPDYLSATPPMTAKETPTLLFHNSIKTINSAANPSNILTQEQENVGNPNFYRVSLATAIASIEATAEKALHLGASRISTLSFLKSTCDELLKHTKELEPILTTYARRWNDGRVEVEEGDMPLNPSLLEWMSHLSRQLLQAQAEMDKIPRGESSKDGAENAGLSAKSIPLHINVALAGCAESLEDALTAIEDFMPIFKTDFDEAQTRKMNIPNRAVGEHVFQPRREPPRPDISRIRSELYLLKDYLCQINNSMQNLCLPDLSEAPNVVRRIRSLIDAITTMLTNNASEWLDSDMGQVNRKTITYDEFLGPRGSL